MQDDTANNSGSPKAATGETAAATLAAPVSIPAPKPSESAVSPTLSIAESKDRQCPREAPPKPHPTCASANNAGTDSPSKPEIPDDTLRLSYEVFLTAGREQVLRVKSLIEFPLALDLENLAQTDVNFPEVLDRILIQPVTTKFHAYLQKRFEIAAQIAAEKEAAAKSPPPPVNNRFEIPRPTNGTEFVVPEPPAKPPMPRIPGMSGMASSQK